MADERLHLAPRHELGVLGVVPAKAPGQQAVEAGAEARIDAGDPPGAVLADQLDVARA